jgi:Domain of unknown function (DUF4832)/Beta-galactosidase
MVATVFSALVNADETKMPVAENVVTRDLTSELDAGRVLMNPHKGWYHHFPDNNVNKYIIAKDADLLDFPGMDHLYMRMAWSYLEPQEGQFDWSFIDPMIKKWTANRLAIAFRISCKETSADRIEQQFATPRWVMEAGAKGGYYHRGQVSGPDGPWEPEYGDPVFLEKLEHFLAVFAARYDGQPWLRYVDIGSIGDWGEGHCWASSRKTLSYAVRKTHVDLYLKYFKRTQLIISDDFVHALPDVNERTTLHRYLLANGISYRDDSIMVNGLFSETESEKRFTVRSPEYFAAAYLTHPTVLELEHYGKIKELGNWDALPESPAFQFGSGKKGPDYFRGAIDFLHATYIGYHGDAHAWLSDNPELTKELLNRCGYWLFPTSVSFPLKVKRATMTPFRMTLENRGVAPPYHAYELRVRLEGEGASWVGVVGQAGKKWLPGSPILVENTLSLAADLKPGHYHVSLGLFDGKRAVELAMKEDLRDPEGYYRISEVDVSAD